MGSARLARGMIPGQAVVWAQLDDIYVGHTVIRVSAPPDEPLDFVYTPLKVVARATRDEGDFIILQLSDGSVIEGWYTLTVRIPPHNPRPNPHELPRVYVQRHWWYYDARLRQLRRTDDPMTYIDLKDDDQLEKVEYASAYGLGLDKWWHVTGFVGNGYGH